MPDDLIAVVDLASQYGKRKQTLFKIVKRLGIVPHKKSSATSRGAHLSYISAADAQRVINQLQSGRAASNGSGTSSTRTQQSLGTEDGVFYLLQLEPDHDPGRFKVGFAINLSERLRALRCAAPCLKVIRHWPCKQLWEKTAIDCVTNGCQQLHTEVFRTQSIESVIGKCDHFFELMPPRSHVKQGSPQKTEYKVS